MAIYNDGCGGDDSEDDDDIVIGVGENFRKHIDALKRACVLEVGHGGYISTPASILSGETPPACEEDEDEEEEEEDDDELFQSIKSKYGSFGFGDSPWFGKNSPKEKKPDIVARGGEDDDDEEDDEEIFRSVEKLYKSGVDSGRQQGRLPDVVSPPKDISDTDARKGDEKTHRSPSPYASPGREAGADGDGGDDGLSPQPVSEAAGELVGRSIASFLPGNWMDTDGDAEYGHASPAGPLEMVAIEQGGDELSSHREEAKEYRRPEHAEVLTDALKKNRQCQRTLRNLLSQVEAKQKENAELQKRVRSLVDFEKYCNRRFAGFFTDQANPSVKLIAAKVPAPLNKSSDSSNKTVSDLQTCGPPENPDVEIFKKLKKKISFTFQTRRWSNEERLQLCKGVRQQVYEEYVRQDMDTLNNADSLDEDFTSLDDHMSKIGAKEFTPREIRDAVPGIDWGEVARLYVVGRTPEECRTRWINHEDPLINKRPWQKVEDKKLLSIAQQHNFCSWEEISKQLGTNRTPAECLIRYQRSLNASIMRSNWTKEEDSRLRAAVEEWGENDWSAVAACLEGRNNSQCLMRWYKVLHPTKKKRGRWSVEEDKRLKWAVSVFGPKKWKQIAEHVPGRTDLQCRERWCNVLDPSIKLGEWTDDEDRILKESVARHGPHRWAAVANDLKIRTDNQCCRRWKLLHPEDQPEFQRTVHIRRTALVGNFQGRKKERPRLGPQDFISRGTDFGAQQAKKAAGRKPVKDKPRRAPQRIDAPIQRGVVDISFPSTTYNAARECRAARILKRRLARAKKAASQDARPRRTASAPNAHMDNGFRAGRLDKSGKGVKRKADQMSDPIELCNTPKRTRQSASRAAAPVYPSNGSDTGRKRKADDLSIDAFNPSSRTKLKVRRLEQNFRVSPSPDIVVAPQALQSVGPEVVSFLDLVQSLESYCNYSRLLANEENRCETTNGCQTRRIDHIDRELESNSAFLSEEATERHYSRRRQTSTSDLARSGHSSNVDEEVAFATRAVLSWPFLRGVQEQWSQGTTYLGSSAGTDVVESQGVTDFGSHGTTDSELGSRSQLATDLASQKTTGFGYHEATNLVPQESTDVGCEGMSDVVSHEGRTDSGPQTKARFGSQRVADWGHQARKESESQGTRCGEFPVPGQNASKTGTEEGRTVSGSPASTDVGYAEVTELWSHMSTQNAVKAGTQKRGDTGAIFSTAVTKPRSKRVVRMRGAISSEKSDQLSAVSPVFRPSRRKDWGYDKI